MKFLVQLREKYEEFRERMKEKIPEEWQEKIPGYVRNIARKLVPSSLPVQKLKKILSVVAGLLVLAGFVFGVKFIFGRKKVEEAPQLTQVRVQRTKKENLSETYTVMGTIRGAVENDLRFEIEGVLAKYNYGEGSRVDGGQILCSLDPQDALSKAAYARSKYNSERSIYFSAAQRLKVYEDLFRMKAVSETKLQEARYETDSANERMKAALSELELGQSNLDKTNLFAPHPGIVAEKVVQAGEFVTPNDVVVKFISLGDANFEADVPEKDVLALKIGMNVKIKCDAYPKEEFLGRLKEVAPTVKERTRTTVIKVGLPNPDGKLRSGMFARGEVQLKEIPEAIVVPSDSIISLGAETKLVPLVKADPGYPNRGIIELRQVIVGTKLGKNIVIEDGLMPDEMVVVETQGQLSDGLQVQFNEAAPVEQMPTDSSQMPR